MAKIRKIILKTILLFFSFIILLFYFLHSSSNFLRPIFADELADIDPCPNVNEPYQTVGANGRLTFILTDERALRRTTQCNQLVYVSLEKNGSHYCVLGSYNVAESRSVCEISIDPPYPGLNTPFTVTVSGLESYEGRNFELYYSTVSTNLGTAGASGILTATMNPEALSLSSGEHVLRVRSFHTGSDVYCSLRINIAETTDDPYTPPYQEAPISILKPECCNIFNPEGETTDCEMFTDEARGIRTSLGCFPTEPSVIIQWVLRYAIMLAGGVGFLLMLYGSFQIMTSSGDPEKLQAGQQILGAAITGLLLIVFSLFLLRFIGADILKIPGWE